MFRCGRAIRMLNPMHYYQRQEKVLGAGLGIWLDVGG